MHLHIRTIVLFLRFSLIWGFGLSWWTQLMSSAIISESFSTWFIRSRCLGLGQNFTYFMYYSRSNMDDHKFIEYGNKELLYTSGYDATRPTKVIIHGFLDYVYITEWISKMKTKLLRAGDFNVIIVDWSCGNGIPFAQASSNTKIVAHALIKLIEFLKVNAATDPTDLHLIGHSLGSVISALVGQGVSNLGRITALDPPGPRFYTASVDERLDPSDANFVDVIHSDIGHHLFEGVGMPIRLGHLDFYPNGGKNQPGCGRSPYALFPRIISAIRYYVSCDHLKSVEYFMDSIKPYGLYSESECQFVGVICQDWKSFEQGKCADCSKFGNCAFMGYNSHLLWNSDIGKQEFYLKTSGEEPFCLFQYRILLETECEYEHCYNATYRRTVDFTPGIIRLELRTNTGTFGRFDDKEEKQIIPGRKYAYLATSQSQLTGITSAEVWFGQETKPNPTLSHKRQFTGLNLKTIQITSITPKTHIRMYAAPEVTVLCASSDKAIGRNIKLNLVVGDC